MSSPNVLGCYSAFGRSLTLQEMRFLRKIKNDCIFNSLRRKKKGTIHGSVGDIDQNYLADLYTSQNGKCHYGLMPIHLRSHCNWQASPERLDNGLGYIHGNVVFIAYEFNHFIQWDKNKISQIPHLVKNTEANISLEDVENARSPNKWKKRQKTKQQFFADQSFHWCYGLQHNKWIPSESFAFYRSTTRCEYCYIEEMPLRTFVSKMLDAARFHSRLRDQRSRSRGTFEINIDDILDLILMQNFRCKYSLIPMVFKHKRKWKCSVERLNPWKGYTRDNIALICYEFNTCTGQRSFKDIDDQNEMMEIMESYQWSSAKFDYFCEQRFPYDTDLLCKLRETAECRKL